MRTPVVMLAALAAVIASACAAPARASCPGEAGEEAGLVLLEHRIAAALEDKAAQRFLKDTLALAGKAPVARRLIREARDKGVRIVAVPGLRDDGLYGTWLPLARAILIDPDRPDTRATVLAHEAFHAVLALRRLTVGEPGEDGRDEATWALAAADEEAAAHMVEAEVAAALDRRGVGGPLAALEEDQRIAPVVAAWLRARAETGGNPDVARLEAVRAFRGTDLYLRYAVGYADQWQAGMAAREGSATCGR